MQDGSGASGDRRPVETEIGFCVAGYALALEAETLEGTPVIIFAAPIDIVIA